MMSSPTRWASYRHNPSRPVRPGAGNDAPCQLVCLPCMQHGMSCTKVADEPRAAGAPVLVACPLDEYITRTEVARQRSRQVARGRAVEDAGRALLANMTAARRLRQASDQ